MKLNKIFFLFVVICIYYSLIFNANASQINETEYFYTIKSVKIEGLITEKIDNMQQFALNKAKQKALEEILAKLGHSDIILTEVNLNSCINSYKIIDEYYDNEYYSMMANFDFNKSIIQDYIQNDIENKNNKKNKEKLVNAVVVLNENYDIVSEYVTFKQWLIKNKITYKPLKITKQQISIRLLNIYESNIYKTLKKLGLNGSIYLE